jgi:DNA-binding NarL/FixJ family response regulator
MNHDLNPREIEILKGLSQGKRYKEIGVFNTVQNQTPLIRQKLLASTTIQAVYIATKRGLI